MKILRKVAMAISALLDVQMPGAQPHYEAPTTLSARCSRRAAPPTRKIISILGHDSPRRALQGSHRLQKLAQRRGEPGPTQRKSFDLRTSYAELAAVSQTRSYELSRCYNRPRSILHGVGLRQKHKTAKFVKPRCHARRMNFNRAMSSGPPSLPLPSIPWTSLLAAASGTSQAHLHLESPQRSDAIFG